MDRALPEIDRLEGVIIDLLSGELVVMVALNTKYKNDAKTERIDTFLFVARGILLNVLLLDQYLFSAIK